MGRRGAGAQRSVAAERCTAGGGAYRQQLAADHRQGVGSIGAARSPGRAWAASGRAIPWQGVGSIGAARSPGRARRQQAADPTGRAWQQQAADPPAGRGSSWPPIHRQQGGQGLEAAKSSRAKDESPTGILSTHIRVAAEKNFFTPRRGVIWAEKRPFPARGRKPCYDFCVGRESPPAKQKLHSADHGAERISP